MHMKRAEVVLLSVRSPHVERILDGIKTVEIRRRPVRVKPGTRVLLYAAATRKELVGSFRVGVVVSATPLALWKRHQGEIGLSANDFYEYLRGASVGHAIPIADVRSLEEPIPLGELRRRWTRFSAPQTHRFVHPKELGSILNGERDVLLPNS